MSRANWQMCWRRRRADAGALLVIGLFFTLFFGWILFSGQVLIAGDAFCYAYPLRSVAWQMIRHGQLPLWTPYVLSGYPLLSMSQLGFGYPLTWGYLLLPGYRAEEIYVLAPFLLAPLFTYGYVRELGRSRLAALLAGLAFAYGGAMTNLLGVVGMATNGIIWLPLLLFFIERARTRRFMPCLLGATAAYALSVLNGQGQLFLYVALVAVPYAACISVGTARAGRHGEAQHKLDGAAWRPSVVALGAVMLGASVAAFQILETLRAVRRSIRSTLAYVWFVSGAFSPYVALKSLAAPLYTERFADVTTYVSPLVCGLAVVACLTVRRFGVRDDVLRVYFWMALAVVSGVLMLGHYTPLYPLLYHVPLLNRFRVPSRHAFEWTFALSVLAAYGWDACQQLRVRRVTDLTPQMRALFIGCGALALCALTSVLWWRATVRARVPSGPTPTRATSWYAGLPISAYLGWKLALLALTLVVLWQGWQLAAKSGRKALLGAVVVLICFVEPYIMVTNWWAAFLKTAARTVTPAALTRYLQPYSPQQNRVYTRIDLFEDEYASAPRVDSLNLTALYGLHNVAGYEPLMLERYSRALGNVGLDGVNPLPGYPPNDTLLADKSHVLDLLNTTFVASFSQLHTSHAALTEHDDVKLDLTEAGTEIKPQTTEPLAFTDTFADALVLVTSLANSADVAQGTPVARLLVLTSDGQTIERSLRAGIDTAEWAHERPDVRAGVRHALAPIFDRQAGDIANSFQACRYLTQISLGARVRVKEIEIENLSDHAPLALWAASLRDTTNGQSDSLSRKLLYLARNPARWQIDRNVPDVLILHNRRAQPRAWLVSEVESVDGEEALRRIRGESTHQFDPTRTALLEVKTDELPSLPGSTLALESAARITNYEPNRLRIETNSSTPTLLVVSEIFYPGWVATMDGQPTRIMLTDYLLRGVALPAGQHRVEMRYTAPAARTGALISAFTLLLLSGLAVYGRRQAGLEQKRADSNCATIL